MAAEQHFIFCTANQQRKRGRPLYALESTSFFFFIPRVALCFRLVQPPIHSSSFCFACDTITSRIILRFCYSATAAGDAALLLVPLRCLLLRRRSVNVAKLMPFDYIANHEYSKAQLLHHHSFSLPLYLYQPPWSGVVTIVTSGLLRAISSNNRQQEKIVSSEG